MKMLSADEAPPASSSSSGGVTPQPMAVEPDMTEPRGLKRGLEGIYMEIVEVCSFITDVNVNEEPHPQIPVMEFAADEELQVKWAEIVRLDEFEAKKDIPREQATGLVLTFTWLRLFW